MTQAAPVRSPPTGLPGEAPSQAPNKPHTGLPWAALPTPPQGGRKAGTHLGGRQTFLPCPDTSRLRPQGGRARPLTPLFALGRREARPGAACTITAPPDWE